MAKPQWMIDCARDWYSSDVGEETRKSMANGLAEHIFKYAPKENNPQDSFDSFCDFFEIYVMRDRFREFCCKAIRTNVSDGRMPRSQWVDLWKDYNRVKAESL